MKVMNQFRVKALLFGLIVFSVSFFACTKEGPQGPKGDTGSAKVTYSKWFTPNSYTVTTVFGIKNFDYLKDAPEITKAILDSGVVITFGKLEGYASSIWPAGQVSQLPVVLTYVSGSTMTDTWSALATEGKLRINFVNNTNYYSSISTSHSFRYIVIPGGAQPKLKNASLTKPDFKNMRYEELCSYLNIPQ